MDSIKRQIQADIDRMKNEDKIDSNNEQNTCQQQQKKIKNQLQKKYFPCSENIDYLEDFEHKIQNLVCFGLNERCSLRLQDLQDLDMEKSEEAFLNVIRVLRFCPEEFTESKRKQILNILMCLMKSRKMSIASKAIICIGYIFEIVKKPPDTELKTVIGYLLEKATSKIALIMNSAARRSLLRILDGILPEKSGKVLIAAGAKHRNKQVRQVTAQLLTILVRKMGPERSLYSNITKPLLVATADFIVDELAAIREYGQIICWSLMKNPNFLPVLKELKISITRDALREKEGGEISTIDALWQDFITPHRLPI